MQDLATTMPPISLPNPSTYEREYDYWPWGALLRAVAEWVGVNLPRAASVCDYMCGTGFLLNEISRSRPDLRLSGCSLDTPYIVYGKEHYPRISLEVADALKWKPPFQPDAVICTAGVHHLERIRQPHFISKVASELASGDPFLLGEELIGPYRNEKERRLAVVDLSSKLIRHLLKNEAPSDVVLAAVDVLGNDLFERGEYKITYEETIRLLEPLFIVESIRHFWPEEDSRIGDFLFVCRKK